MPFLTPFAVLSCGPEDPSKALHPHFRESKESLKVGQRGK